MIDQERQATFSRQFSHYSVTLAMKEKQLEIKVLDNEVLHKFHVTIDREFIGKQDVLFTSLFESPEDVFTYLTENFSQVVVDKGVLRFRYTVGKKHQVKDIELTREEVDESVLLHLKIAKIEEHFTAQLRHKEDRIVALQQGLRELVSQFKEYKKESRLKMERTEEKLQEEQIYSKGLEGKIKIQEKTIKILEETMQREEKIARDILEKMEMQEKSSKSIEEMLSRQEKSSKSTEERLQKAGNIAGQLIESIPKAISHHPNNTHQQYYTITNCTATSARLALVTGAGYGNCTSCRVVGAWVLLLAVE